MRDIPVLLDGYRLTVVEPPCPKVKEDGSPVMNRDGIVQFVVSLFAKQRAQPGQRAAKGEEIRVTLETDPGAGFEEDMRVALVQPRISAYQMEREGQVISGISFKALGLSPAASLNGRGDK